VVKQTASNKISNIGLRNIKSGNRNGKRGEMKLKKSGGKLKKSRGEITRKNRTEENKNRKRRGEITKNKSRGGLKNIKSIIITTENKVKIIRVINSNITKHFIIIKFTTSLKETNYWIDCTRY